MFIILEGTVEVWINVADGKKIEVARMGPGKFFGEMSLLTGETRTASVIATTDSQLIEVSKADIAPMIQRKPRVVEDLSNVLLDRKQATESRTSGKTTEDDKLKKKMIINQIRGFFIS